MADDEVKKAAAEEEEEIEAETEQSAEQTGSATEQEKHVEQEPKKKDSKLDDLLKERRKRQELEKQLRELQEKSIDKDYLAEKSELKRLYIEEGMTDLMAEKMADHAAKTNAELARLKATVAGLSNPVRDEINELASSDEFYADAHKFEKEIAEKMKAYKGMSAQEAYMLIRGRDRSRELRENLEAQAQYERKEVEGKTVPSAAAGKPSKDPYPLTEEQEKALKFIQANKPELQMTREKYWKLSQR